MNFSFRTSNLAAGIIVCSVILCRSQGTLHMSFDGPPLQPPGSQFLVQQYVEKGMRFTPIAGTDGFARTWTNMPPELPNNGTPYLQAGAVDSLAFSFIDSSLFGIQSVQLAAFSIGLPNYVVNFVGYHSDGSTIAQSFAGSGINFQTYTFSPEWAYGLTRVEIPNYGWSLDNLVIVVPEPGAGALFVAGGLIFSFLKKREL